MSAKYAAMGWSFSVGTWLGIDVRVHATLPILLVWIAWSSFAASRSTAAVLTALLSVVLVFGSVLLHEYGHALAARHYGVETSDITLLPIGGVAAIENMPTVARQEVMIAAAGPAVNAALALVCFASDSIGHLGLTEHPLLPQATLLGRLAWVNVSLAAFNMLPALPLDGGRVLRALAVERMGEERATRIVAGLGQALAVALGLGGLLTWHPLVIFVALFIWVGAAGERREAAGSAVSRLLVYDAMEAGVLTLLRGDKLPAAAQRALGRGQQHFPVLDERHRVIGVVTSEGLIRSLRTGPIDAAEVMESDFAKLPPEASLGSVLPRLRGHACDVAAVVDDQGQFVGLLTPRSLAGALITAGVKLGS